MPMILLSSSLKEFDDGHSPGSTETKTQLVEYNNKTSENFLTVFDNLLSDIWCTRAYTYAINQLKPWGTYVTTRDAMDLTLCADDIWNSGDCERAISLITVRTLLFERGLTVLGKDVDNIHGSNQSPI